tara:strand:- start:37943 stop:38146 length:204 start_codon:yes stop_codon:yes gene_type:complete
MQFVDALIKTKKDFELVTIPGAPHSAGGDYGERKRKDFFVKNLLNVFRLLGTKFTILKRLKRIKTKN